MEKKTNYKIKWQHVLIIFAIVLAVLPALIIGLNLISKTEQELTHSVNLQLTNIANNVSNEINFFFVDQIKKQYLIKKSVENESLGANEKVALIISAVSSIDELVSIALVFKERTGLTTAIQSQKAFVDSLDSDKNKEIFDVIGNMEKVADELISGDKQFGNPIYIKSLDYWCIYSILPVKLNETPDAYLVSLINLSSLEENLSKPSYSGTGSIIITNVHGESIFNSIDSLTNQNIVSDAIDMLKGNARVTQVSSYVKDDEKFVFSASFTKNIKWVVIAIENYNKAYSLVTDMNKTMSIWIILGIALAILFGILTIHRIRKPINHLVEKAKELSNGNFDIKVDYKLDDSIGTLGATMESMGKSLKNSFIKIEKQNIELEDYNKTLENKVLDRTQKLKETNDDLQKAYTQVLELNNEKNEFLGIAAHDLKNPLVAIKGFGEIIQHDDKLTREDLEEFAGTIVESSERMFDIITSLLDINRIEEGRIEIKYDVVSANGMVEKLITQNLTIATKKDIALNFKKLEPDVKFETDEALVLQVLDNFLSNAIKFSPKGKWIDVNMNNSKGYISIAVKDNGPGLNENDKLRMFKKFVKLSATPTDGENSTGLGLSIAKKITEMLGGDILVESEVGNGATFAIKLPK
ncbi:MAG: ATP-binding protein [Melioribacteraceae bacterium]|nr:ATP-binding protein [Melioribacteraceae bacterium]